MSESLARAALVVVALVACVAGLVALGAAPGDDAARSALLGALVVLAPAAVDATRVAVREGRARRER